VEPTCLVEALVENGDCPAELIADRGEAIGPRSLLVGSFVLWPRDDRGSGGVDLDVTRVVVRVAGDDAPRACPNHARNASSAQSAELVTL
jgi:hypothetical protein